MTMKRILIQLPVEIIEELNQKINSLGISRAALIRKVLIDELPRNANNDDYKEILFNIKNATNNLNQLTRYAHQSGGQINNNELKSNIIYLRNSIKDIRKKQELSINKIIRNDINKYQRVIEKLKGETQDEQQLERV